ncbi:MAG: DUF2283 domain-containing protein [Nitrososphaerales archaeon]|jgi:uncharacterized protein YuzE
MSELWYDAEEDVLGIQFSKRKYWKSVEVASNVVVDLAKNGEIIGIEILKAKESFKRDVPMVISGAKKRK